MPVLSTIATIATILGTGVGVGTGIYNATQSGGGQPATTPVPTAAQNIQAEVNKRSQEAQIVNRQIPDLISQTSGGLSDQAYQTAGSSAAGLPGTFGAGGIDLNQIMSFLGGGPTNPGNNSQPPTNLLNMASGFGTNFDYLNSGSITG